MSKIPKFQTIKEEAEFWDTHSLVDYLDDTEPVEIKVDLVKDKKKISIPLESDIKQQIEKIAVRKGISVSTLVALWLKEKLVQEKKPLRNF
ncbi:MAG: CopG family antitoxin [bacterium]